MFQFSKPLLTNIDVDTAKFNEHIKILNDSHLDQWLENIKDIFTTVSKCINGEQYMEAAQLVFAVITNKINNYPYFSKLFQPYNIYGLIILRFRWYTKRSSQIYNQTL